ncbi:MULTISPECIES: BlaI/MecI/CopY family transcriptional regulator [Sphingobacterium]|uniref:BlaI/MecI/CopY family transcriptional regulator n=1 Tax=Sphingobacterium TaxID=28453 RepID=UPI001051DA28|nr:MULTISPECIES: BlaI/MecI/CopY family transcriptional regulator [Sphingobacterium]MCW2258580.1 putative transcriptional regulator [Sphingobacterium kitahiroshimense]TCR14961.1 putative transcriptional regulator [Sphingobacterium sp. JUb78]
MNQKNEPTKAELEILRALWKLGPSTVRQINEAINEERPVNYTSTLKLMQIMTEKGLLKRDESQMKHIYHVVEEEETTKSNLLDSFVKTIYQGSASNLVMQLLGNKKTSQEDLQAIKNLIENLEDNK